MIEESLKSAQFAQRLALLVCATLLFFAFSTSTSVNEYRLALEELERIEFALPEVDRLHGIQVSDFYREQGLLKVFQEEFHDIDTTDLSILVLLSLNDKRTFGIPGIRGTIGAIYKYLSTTAVSERLEVYTVNLVDLRAAIKSFRNSTTGFDRVLTVVLSGEKGDFSSIKEAGQTRITIDTTQPGLPGTYEHYISGRDGMPIVRYTSVQYLEPTVAIEMLRGQQLVYDSGDRLDALPLLRRVWGLINKHDTDIVRPMLNLEADRRKAELERDITILGMKIESTTLIQTGPVLLASVLLYLLAHIIHLKNIAAGNERVLRESPWMGIYSDRLAMCLMYISIAALPIVSTLLLVVRSNTSVLQKIFYGIIYTAVFSTISYFLTKHTRQMNQAVASSIAPSLFDKLHEEAQGARVSRTRRPPE